MSLSVSYSQSSVSAQFLYASSGQGTSGAGQAIQPEHKHHQRRMESDDDQLTLSSAAQRPRRVHREHDDDDRNSMSAMDKLVSRLVRTMLKSMMGQGFQLQEPGQAVNQGGAATPTAGSAATTAAPEPSVATTVPAATAPEAAPTTTVPGGPFSNAVAAYYQVQSFSFDANASVSTEDGQQLGISVHFSFSQQFYAAVGVAGSVANNGVNPPQEAGATAAVQPKPASNPFQGIAAQLTQTSFSFEVDMEGQPEQADDAAATATVPSPTPGASTPASEVLNVKNPVVAASEDAGESILEQLDKLFEKLQVWLKHPDGGRQLVAIGINSTSARYVGILVDERQQGATIEQPALDSSSVADQENAGVVNALA